MKRLVFFNLILASLLLCACSAPPPEPETASVSAPTLPPVTPGLPAATSGPQTPTQSPAPVATLEPISGSDHMLGNPQAAVTMLIYADFQSPASAFLMNMIPETTARHPENLRVIFRPFPLITVNEHALAAAHAAEAAALQNRFWDLTDTLFSMQDIWRVMSAEEFQTWLLEQAQILELDTEQFKQDLSSAELEEDLLEDFYQNVAAGLFNAPTIFLNGNEYLLPLTAENIEASIRLEELRSRQMAAYPEFTLDPEADYTARIHTSLGTLDVQLHPGYAPLAVNSFINLVETGWYDSTPFYRVVQGSFAEAGDPTGTGLGDPGYVFPTETDPTLGFSRPGMIAMVSQAQDANGSSFFITMEPMQHLDGYRTIFGRVTAGLELLETLQTREPMEQLLEEPEAEILTIEIIRD